MKEKGGDKIVELNVIDSRTDVEVNKVLEIARDFDEVVVIGIKDGRMMVATSSGKQAQIILRLEQARSHMIGSFCGIDYIYGFDDIE